jgi:uncharacterized protein (TIGR02145 family)
MKTFLKYILAVAVVAFAAVSCQNEPEEAKKFNIAFTVENGTAEAFIGEDKVTSAEPGAIVTLRARPNQGYNFTGWSSEPYTGFSDRTKATTTFQMPESDITLTAGFEENVYILNYVVGPLMSGGIVVEVDGKSIASGTSVAGGKTVTLTANASEGHEFAEWQSDVALEFGEEGSKSPETSFVMPTEKVELTALFAAKAFRFEFAANPTDGGNVAVGMMDTDPMTILHSGTLVPFGSMLGAVYEENDGYKFTGWSSEEIVLSAGDKTENELLFTMPNKMAKLTANFSKMQQFNIAPLEHGQISAVVWFNDGTNRPAVSGEKFDLTGGTVEIVLNATADNGYKFTGWTKDPASLELISDGTYARFNMIEQTVTIGATFEEEVVSEDPFVLIAGTKWATRNVGEPGQFVANPADYGRYYQFGYAVGWLPQAAPVPADGKFYMYNSAPFGWGNDTDGGINTPYGQGPCPEGWKVPSQNQYYALIDATSAVKGSAGTTFTQKGGTASVFFPHAGYMSNPTAPSETVSAIDIQGYYWANEISNTYGLWNGVAAGPPPTGTYFSVGGGTGNTVTGNLMRPHQLSVRCVMAE